MGRWSRLETWLAEHHGWYDLDEVQQRDLGAARGLFVIEAHLDRLAAEQEALLERLASLPARSPSEVVAKLAVAMELLASEDEPQVHRLIADAWRKLSAKPVDRADI